MLWCITFNIFNCLHPSSKLCELKKKMESVVGWRSHIWIIRHYYPDITPDDIKVYLRFLTKRKNLTFSYLEFFMQSFNDVFDTMNQLCLEFTNSLLILLIRALKRGNFVNIFRWMPSWSWRLAIIWFDTTDALFVIRALQYDSYTASKFWRKGTIDVRTKPMTLHRRSCQRLQPKHLLSVWISSINWLTNS